MRNGVLFGGVVLASLLTFDCGRSLGRQAEPGEVGAGGASDAGAGGRATGGAGGTASGHAGTSSRAGGVGTAGRGITSGGTDAGGGSGGSGAGGGASGGRDGGADASGGVGETVGGAENHGAGDGGTSGSGPGGESGTGGESGAGSKSCSGRGLSLSFESDESYEARIDGSTNCLGLAGGILTHLDEVGSTMTVTFTTDTLCASGVAKHYDPHSFTDGWGSILVIRLAHDLVGYDATSHGIDGFKFSVSGDALPNEILVAYTNVLSRTPYGGPVCTGGEHSLLIADATDGAGQAPTGKELDTLQFWIQSNDTVDVPFDFCVGDIIAITDGVSVGNPGCSG